MSAALLGEWSRLLLGSLEQAGVREVVVSPGSRSTPFAWAAAGTANLRCHALYDERSAAFFALGLARVTGEPALLVCTSGSAAANYFPAVVEASVACVPLLVLTADRPLELQDAGAPQTIDQVKLYGGFTRGFFDLGLPDGSSGSLHGLRRIAAQAALATQTPRPGPVHLNARARKPLEPAPPSTPDERSVAAEVERLLARRAPRAFAAELAPSAGAIGELRTLVQKARRGVIVCGPMPFASSAGRSIHALSCALGIPVYAEATSQARFGAVGGAAIALDALDWVFRTPAARSSLAPDLVLRFGATPASSAFEGLVTGNGATELVVVTEHGYSDPTSTASLVVQSPPRLVAERLLAALGNRKPLPEQLEYAERLKRANGIAWATVEERLGSGSFDEAGGALVVRRAVEALPPGGVLVVGNSLPVREVDAFVRAGERGLGVVSQRGANGIDGVVSGAAGTALAAGRPTLLLVGDVSFAHDLSGLHAARAVRTPFVVLVLDNDGGRIFEQLPVERLFTERPETAELWLTPPRLALEHAGRLFGVPYERAASLRELDAALAAALSREGPTLVHAAVSPHGALETHRAVLELVEARLARGVPA